MRERIEVIQGDITKLDVDAIVNAANSTLMGGSGVDGAIHAAAGPALLAECVSLKGCTTGKAKITKGYKLPAKYVIHAVGPTWQDGTHGEDDLLSACYENSLSLAVEKGLRTIAFPAISTGAYGFPLHRAVKIAVTSVKKFLSNDNKIEKITFVCYEKQVHTAYTAVVNQLVPA